MVEYRVADRMHRQLRGYKDAPVQEARQMYLRNWLVSSMTGWPPMGGSSAGGSAPHGRGDDRALIAAPAGAPVDAIVAMVPGCTSCTVRCWCGDRCRPVTWWPIDGDCVEPGLDLRPFWNRTVLVVDDSVITGARAQSAAAALRLGGSGWPAFWLWGVPSTRPEGREPPRCPRAGEGPC